MSWFLRPPHATYGIGICARCQQKFWLDELMDDPNSPGLKVCGIGDGECGDVLDPYRLPPLPPDQITLEFTRPDVPVDNPTPYAPPDPDPPFPIQGS